MMDVSETSKMVKTSEVVSYGADGSLPQGEPCESSPAIAGERQVVQFFAVLSGVFIWRASYYRNQQKHRNQ